MGLIILALGLPVALAFKDTAGFHTLCITHALQNAYSTISVTVLGL
jgi:hypothetical protein